MKERGIKLDTFKGSSTEVFVTGHGIAVTVSTWSNHEGANVMIHQDRQILSAMSLRWEELDVLMLAISAAKAS